jgi:hypothetical protein
MMAAGQLPVSVLGQAPAWIWEPQARRLKKAQGSKALAVEPEPPEDESGPPGAALDLW